MVIKPTEEKNLDSSSEEKFKGKIEFPPEKEKESFEIEKEPASELSPTERDNAYNRILSKLQESKQITVDPNAVNLDASLVNQEKDAEGKIQYLVDLAQNKGVFYAVKVAQHLENNYVLDMFHDKLLSDVLHDALVKKGLIKEI